MMPNVMWWMCRPPGVTFLNGPTFARMACVIARTIANVVKNDAELMNWRSLRRSAKCFRYSLGTLRTRASGDLEAGIEPPSGCLAAVSQRPRPGTEVWPPAAPRPGVAGARGGRLCSRGCGCGRLVAPPRQQGLARDHKPLDLGGPLIQLEDLRVPHELLDRVVLDEPIAAVDLDGIWRDLHRRVGGEPRGVGGLERVGPALVQQ